MPVDLCQGDNCWWVQPGEIFPQRSDIDEKRTAEARAREPMQPADRPVDKHCDPTKPGYDVLDMLAWGFSDKLEFNDTEGDKARFKNDAELTKRAKHCVYSGTWFCKVIKVIGDKITIKVEPEQPGCGVLKAKAQEGAAGEERTFSNGGSEAPEKDGSYLCDCDPDFPSTGYPNMTEIKFLNEAELAKNLKLYLANDNSYCMCGDTLVAINSFSRGPFVEAPFGKNMMDEYKNGREAPHAYKTAKMLHEEAMKGLKNQCLIITGESGAGKTFNTRNILDYLAHVGIDNDTLNEKGKVVNADGTISDPVTDRMLDSSEILDAFGNATMPRNDDSSRFGKLYKVYLDKDTGYIKGAKIMPFLLEKSRVNKQASKERNFHVFYKLTGKAETDADFKAKYQILDKEKYRYLNRFIKDEDLLDPANAPVRDGNIEDVLVYGKPYVAAKETGGWEKLDQCLRTAFKATHAPDVVDAMLDQIWSNCSAVLLMGQLVFSKEDVYGAETILNRDLLDTIASLLKIDKAELEQNLASKQDAKDKTKFYGLPSSKVESAVKSLSGSLYDSMFSWIIDEVSAGLKEQANTDEGAGQDSFVGVLDIFGFECTAESKISAPILMNSFEQYCINLCNEYLQNKYQSDIMDSEKNAIKQQLGRDLQINFTDNAGALEATDKHKSCIKNMLKKETQNAARCGNPKQRMEDFDQAFTKALDKEMKAVTYMEVQGDGTKKKTGSGTKFVAKLTNRHSYFKEKKKLKKGKKGSAEEVAFETLDRTFTVEHYAGEVLYDSLEWTLKNWGKISEGLLTVFSHSPTSFPGTYMQKQTGADAPPKKDTILEQFSENLTQLMDILTDSDCRFVRCIKSNIYKTSNVVQGYLLLNQLRYTGMMDALKIRKMGYPYRVPIREFMSKYGVLNRELGVVAKAREFADWVIAQPYYKVAQDEDKGTDALIDVGEPTKYHAASDKPALMLVKDALVSKLDSDLKAKLGVSGNIVQTIWRAKAERSQFIKIKNVATKLGPVIEGVLVRKKFLDEYRQHYEPQDREQMQSLIFASVQRQIFYEKKLQYESLQQNMATLQTYLEVQVIAQHENFAVQQHEQASQLRVQADLEINQMEVRLASAKAGVNDVMNEKKEHTKALQLQLKSTKEECEELRSKQITLKKDTARTKTTLTSEFSRLQTTWKGETDTLNLELTTLASTPAKITSDSETRLASAHHKHELKKAQQEKEEEAIRRQTITMMKESHAAGEQQLDTKNKHHRQLVVAREKQERLEANFHQIDDVHANERAELEKSLVAQNWKLAQLHVGEQQSAEEFENLGLFIQPGHLSGGGSEASRQIDVLDAQIAVLKDQMTQSAETRLILRSKLDHLSQTKHEVEDAWHLAVQEQDTTVERLTDALEKERRVSDKLEQACKQPGPSRSRHSRFVSEPEPEQEIYRESAPSSHIVNRPAAAQYSTYQSGMASGRYQVGEGRREEAHREEAAKEPGLQSLNALYKGRGTVHVSELEKLDSTTLGAALRLLI